MRDEEKSIYFKKPTLLLCSCCCNTYKNAGSSVNFFYQ